MILLSSEVNSVCYTEVELRTKRLMDLCEGNPNGVQLGAVIGSGSYGTVHRLVSAAPTSFPEIAKKIVFHRSESDKERMFVNEINSLNCLSANQNAFGFVPLTRKCRVGFSGDEVRLILMMPEIRNGDLTRLMRSSAFPELESEWKLSLMKKLAHSLKSIHNSRIMNRDIKPDNIMFNDSSYSTPFFIDFGFSSLESSSTTPVGTSGYTAPEILRLADRDFMRAALNGVPLSYDNKVDVFSLGVVFLQLWNNQNGIRRERNGDYALPTYPAGVPTRVQSLINGMLAFNPQNRLSINQVYDQINLIRAGQTSVNRIMI